MPPAPQPPIRDKLANAGNAGRSLWGVACEVRLDTLVSATRLEADPAELEGTSVLIATRDPLAAAVALVELDGVARRLIVGTPDLSAEHLPRVLARGAVDAIVVDALEGAESLAGARPLFVCSPGTPGRARPAIPAARIPTDWV